MLKPLLDDGDHETNLPCYTTFRALVLANQPASVPCYDSNRHYAIPLIMKTCTKCKKSKNLDCFHKDKTTVDGLYSWCKPCKKARKRYPERQIKRKKEYYIENKNYILKRQAKYYAENKQARRAYQIKYEKENPHIRANISSKRRARQKQAIPKWANLNKIKNIYKNCPKGMEVDHIVPLQHPLVCGLHVEDNLQYLPVSENRKKHNKLDYKPQSIEA